MVERAKQPRRRHPQLLALVLAAVIAGGATTYLLVSRAPTSDASEKNVTGEREWCWGCHPAGAQTAARPHPKIAGHTDLGKLGCTPCHGGRASGKTRARAHAPSLGDGPAPYLGSARARVACARCHVIGSVTGMKRLRRGRSHYLAGSCNGCHAPGHRGRSPAPDLRRIAPSAPAALRERVLHPRRARPGSAMWSLRDPTYRKRFSTDERGRRNVGELVDYVLALGDSTARRRFGKSTLAPDAAERCARCHRAGATSRPSGAKHRCAFLADNATLRCRRCHATSTTGARPGTPATRCPQLRAALPLCATCHLGDDPTQPGRHEPAR